ncbi:hypothetical protein Droror1_Dr00026958, partial [Drosera rotundifolia]
MKGVKLRDLYYLVGNTVVKDGTAVILTKNEPSQDDDGCGGDSYGGHGEDPLIVPDVVSIVKDVADAIKYNGGNVDDEDPVKTHCGATDALLWHYRLGHVIEKGMQ